MKDELNLVAAEMEHQLRVVVNVYFGDLAFVILRGRGPLVGLTRAGTCRDQRFEQRLCLGISRVDARTAHSSGQQHLIGVPDGLIELRCWCHV